MANLTGRCTTCYQFTCDCPQPRAYFPPGSDPAPCGRETVVVVRALPLSATFGVPTVLYAKQVGDGLEWVPDQRQATGFAEGSRAHKAALRAAAE